jgi:hypothetical protein
LSPPIFLSGLGFPFFGKTFSSVKISSNGCAGLLLE